jgi:hypothetical protein
LSGIIPRSELDRRQLAAAGFTLACLEPGAIAKRNPFSIQLLYAAEMATERVARWISILVEAEVFRPCGNLAFQFVLEHCSASASPPKDPYLGLLYRPRDPADLKFW